MNTVFCQFITACQKSEHKAMACKNPELTFSFYKYSETLAEEGVARGDSEFLAILDFEFWEPICFGLYLEKSFVYCGQKFFQAALFQPCHLSGMLSIVSLTAS